MRSTFASGARPCARPHRDPPRGVRERSKSPTTGGTGSSLSGQLNGSGSTFQQTFDQVAIQAFQNANSGVTVNYAGGGSGKGKTDLQTKTVDFAGTDSLVKAADVPKYQGGKILYFPTVAAPITVSYKLSGVDKLQLSGPTIAKIFGHRSRSGTTPRSRPTTRA